MITLVVKANLFFFLFAFGCIEYPYRNPDPDSQRPRPIASKPVSHVFLRVLRSADKRKGIHEEIPASVWFQKRSEGKAQWERIFPLPLRKSQNPTFLLGKPSPHLDETLLSGCMYGFPLSAYAEGTIHIQVEGLVVKTVRLPYDWQNSDPKFVEYDLSTDSFQILTIPRRDSYDSLFCSDDLRYGKNIPSRGVVTPPEED